MNEIGVVPVRFQRILYWYNRAAIDYHQQYITMYIAYNAWYQEATGTINDRQAIAMLKKRYVIWDDYTHGKTLHLLSEAMHRLVDLTQKEPFPSATHHWNGEIDSIHDWSSLIEFWYQTRCAIVHGELLRMDYSELALATLGIFMDEIVSRMKHTAAGLALQKNSQQTYTISSGIWRVDMRRVS